MLVFNKKTDYLYIVFHAIMEKENFSCYLYAGKYLIFLLTYMYFVIDYDLILMLPSAFESTDYILYSHQYTF